MLSSAVFSKMTPANETSQMDLVDRTENRQAPPADDVEPAQSISLPPVDGGRAAWLFLAGSFVIETLLWGI